MSIKRAVFGLGFILVSCTAFAAIPPSERAALIALYNATDGDNWTDNTNWNGGVGTECTWFGVSCDGGETAVQGLNLTNNGLSGQCPSELENLNRLVNLNLGSNQVSGTIPAELGNLSNLEWLYLYLNHLTASIPTELANLSSLQGLALWGNQLEGSIPTELGALASLRELWLANNELSGPIPTQVGDLANLEDLSIEGNDLSGVIPNEIGALGNMWYLNLGSNRLDGTIPAGLGNLSELWRLILSDNRLDGTIPSQMANLTALNGISLRSNQLVGTVPAELTAVPMTAFEFNGFREAGGSLDITQTVAPEDLAVTSAGSGSVFLSWTPIPFLANNGAYRVLFSSSPGGPFSQYGETFDKTVSFVLVEGLNPASTYYFQIETVTEVHANNQGAVLSEASTPVPGTTASPGPAGSLQLSHSAYQASEGEPKAITVRRLGGSTGAVSVLYSTSPGSASPGVDYTPTSEWLAWNDGDADPKTLTVQILDDASQEGDETFTVSLDATTGGATLGSPTAAVVTIDDNDYPNGDEGDTNSTGYNPAVATDENGFRIVVWAEEGADGDGLGIVGQRYSPAGTSIGPQFVVNELTDGDQHSPAVATTGSGRFIVIFVSESSSKGEDERQGTDGIFARGFEWDGTPTGSDTQVNTTGIEHGDEVVVTISGDRVTVVWQATPVVNRDGNDDIFARSFDFPTSDPTNETTVDDGGMGNVEHATAGLNGNGNIVIAWSREDSFGWDDVCAQRFDSNLNPVGSELLVNVDTYRDQTEASVIVEPDGDFALTWRGPSLPDQNGNRSTGSDIFFRRFTADGVPEGDPIRVNASEAGAQTNPVLVVNPLGDCWTAWEDVDDSGIGGIYGVHFPNCTDPVGGEQLLMAPGGSTSIRHMDFTFAGDGAITAIFVKDDINEGDGSVVGFSMGQSDSWLFSDGFSSGDTSAWSVVVP